MSSVDHLTCVRRTQSPGQLWKAVGPPVGFGKAWQKSQCTVGRSRAPCRLQQKPQGTLEVSRAPCGLWQSTAEVLGNSGEKQGPLRDSAKPSKCPGELWKAAGPLAGFGKAWQKPQGTGRQQGPLQVSATPSKSPGELWKAEGPLMTFGKSPGALPGRQQGTLQVLAKPG